MKIKTLLMLGAAAFAWKKLVSDQDGAARLRARRDERDLDEALDETFPASDPPSMTSPTSPVSSRQYRSGM